MKINIKKMHPEAVIPQYAKEGDAGCDLVAVSKTETDLYIEYDTGIAFEIPEGYVGLVFPRSSISKYHLDLANSVGVIDSGFRGSVTARFKKTSNTAYQTTYNVGDKVCQIIVLPYPKVEFLETAELTKTVRGSGGYGSTGA
jgi:dUTP pyrophosphatase